MIHPSAIVSTEARIGVDVSIGAFAVVEAGAVVGDRCVLLAHSIVRRGSELAEAVQVHSFTVVGGPPQALNFDEATRSSVRIGARTILREGVTINRSMKAEGVTVVGADCFIMAAAHVAHDCVLADRVILANAVMLAGHCEVGVGSFLGGGCGVHQFVRIGESVMVGGLARITRDLPPFLLVAERDEVSGLNLIGMRRRGFSRETIAEIKTLYRRVFAAGSPREHATAALTEGAAMSAEGRRFLEFFAGGKRHFARPVPGAVSGNGSDAEASDG